MSKVTPEILESYLSDYGWGFRKVSPGHWVTGWSGRDRAYPLAVTLGDTWLSFQVRPFLRLAVDWDSWPELSLFLLELNHASHMVKLVVDERGDICLALEIFANHVAFSSFADALGVLGYYCDSLYEQIMGFLDRIGLSLDPSLKYLT